MVFGKKFILELKDRRICACTQFSAWLQNHRKKLLPSYRKFLNFQGYPNNIKILELLKDNFIKKNSIGLNEVNKNIFTNGHLNWIISHYISRSIPFYTTLNLLQFSMNMNKSNLYIILKNISMSSTFLTLYCYFAWVQLYLTLNKSELIYRLGLMIPGITLILERNPITRKAISHYCLCMSLYGYLKQLNSNEMPYITYIAGSTIDKLRIRTLINMI